MNRNLLNKPIPNHQLFPWCSLGVRQSEDLEPRETRITVVIVKSRLETTPSPTDDTTKRKCLLWATLVITNAVTLSHGGTEV